MRPSTPLLNLAASLAPSWPPTPTAAAYPPFFARKISPRSSPGPGPGPERFTPPDHPTAASKPANPYALGSGQPGHLRPVRSEESSPCSSDSSSSEDSESQCSDDESRPDLPFSSPGPTSGRTGQFAVPESVVHGNLIIEELSDFDEDDMQGRDDVVRPYKIEFADAEPSHIDGNMLNKMGDLTCRSPGSETSSDGSDMDDAAHQEMIQRIRDENRRKRASMSSVGTKRTMSARGSDSDNEDVHRYFNFEEAGSSARHLKRRRGEDRLSLIFHDPPPRIDEVVEPEEFDDLGTLAKELPFYELMSIDSPRSSSG